MMMETALRRIGVTPAEMSAMTAAQPTYPTGEIQLLDSGRREIIRRLFLFSLSWRFFAWNLGARPTSLR